MSDELDPDLCEDCGQLPTEDGICECAYCPECYHLWAYCDCTEDLEEC